MKVILGVIVVLLLLVESVMAVPLNHEAPDGVVAVVAHTQFNESKSFYVSALLLDTQGKIYILEREGKIVPYSLPYGLKITWPVDFSMIVDWTPMTVGIPGSDDFFVHQGMILTKDGDHWFNSVKVRGGWDMQGKPEVKTKWRKVSLIYN